MTDLELTGIWNGSFSYNLEESDPLFGIQTPIQLVIHAEDGNIEGICHDAEYEALVKEAIHLKGFEEDGFISLIVKYPYYCYKDLERKIHIDYNFPHPDKHFSGTFDPVNKVFHGIWEMEMVIENDQQEEQLVLFSGDWEIQKQE